MSLPLQFVGLTFPISIVKKLLFEDGGASVWKLSEPQPQKTTKAYTFS
jgi:hypothetical protein